MKKILSLVAVFAMAVGAYAQESEEPKTETWTATSTTPANKTVELTNIKAEFLDGSDTEDGSSVWTFSKSYASANKNSAQIRFTPAVDGYLAIVPAADIAQNKRVCMIVNEDPNTSLDATYNDPEKGDVTITHNVLLSELGYAEGIKSGSRFTYGIKAGNTYNFYFLGTKWRLKSFDFTPGEVAGGIEVEKVALLVTADVASDVTSAMITEGVDWLEENPVLADATISLDDENVQAADVIVISNNVPADAAVVASLKSIIAYKPVVNLSAPLYAAWGYGEATISESKAVVLTEAYAENENLSALATGNVVEEVGAVATLALGDYFKDDAIIATVEDKPAIHIHNANRNAYIGAPISADAYPGSALTDLVIMAAKTKKGVTNTATPTFALTKSNMETSVEIKSSTTGAVIYYTEDGSEPTVASKVYTEPLVYHAETTVKAVAIADGFNLSAVAETKVEIFSQVATPEIAVAKNGATSTVTLSCATEGADIYYNFADFSASTKDIDMLGKKYTEPIVLSEPTMIYAKAVKGKDALDSEMASYYVAIADVNASNIRLDVVSKFTADYFAWAGKTGTSAVYIWSEDPSTDKASWTEGEVKTQTPAEGATADLDWKLVSKGQKLCLESGSVEVGVGDSTKTKRGERGAARFFDSVEDLIGSEIGNVKLYTNKNFLGTKSAANEENTDNASVESTKKFTAPFDVVVYLGNGKGKEKHADLEISEDGQTWTKAADLNVSVTLRYIKKTRVSIDKDSYVRVLYKDSDVNVADIVILNNGEESKKYDAAEFEAAGIEDVEAIAAEVVRTEIYNINGVQLPELTTGVNIVRTYYSDGSVKTEKVLSK